MATWNIKRGAIKQDQVTSVFYYFQNKIRDNSLDLEDNKDAIDYFNEHLKDFSINSTDDSGGVGLIQLHINEFTALIALKDWRRFQVYFNQRVARGIHNKKTVKAKYETTGTVTVNNKQLAFVKEVQERLQSSSYPGSGRGGKVTQSDAFQYLVDGGSLHPLKKLKNAIEVYNSCIDEYNEYCYSEIDKLMVDGNEKMKDELNREPTKTELNNAAVTALNNSGNLQFSKSSPKHDFKRWNKNTIKRK